MDWFLENKYYSVYSIWVEIKKISNICEYMYIYDLINLMKISQSSVKKKKKKIMTNSENL